MPKTIKKTPKPRRAKTIKKTPKLAAKDLPSDELAMLEGYAQDLASNQDVLIEVLKANKLITKKQSQNLIKLYYEPRFLK